MSTSNDPEHALVLLGGALHELREQRGVSMDELAAAAGVAPGMLAALEAGRLDPAYDLLLALADALGVRPSALVIRAEELGRELTGGYGL